MKDQLIKLLALQEHDIQLQEMQKEKAQIPSELDSMKKDVQELENILAKEEGNLQELEGWKTEQEDFLKEEEQRIQKRMQYLDGVSNGKEYFDLQKELDNHRKKARDHESEILKLMEAVDDRKKVVDDRKAQIERFRAQIEKKEAESTGRIAELTARIEKLTGDRIGLLEGLDKRLLRRFEFLASRKGIAMAKAEGEMCRGCNMGIPPQKFNSLYNPTEIYECPFCGRILFIEEALREQ
ncbi:hypothetical protein KKF34_15430 [Myxococcota bacterium]|nr:hypothetical protein [Myxococcota bacterium]MBU1498268.1 hypothetical protein [Myxococcota bacterium]